MAFIVETGAGVANANSYGNVEAATSYAADRGIALSDDDAVVQKLLILATDYLESFEYIGVLVSPTQALKWPRKCVEINDAAFPNNALPTQLVAACYQLVLEQTNGIDIQPTVDRSEGGFIIEEKVDVLMTRFSEKIGTTSEPSMPKVDALLRNLIVGIPALRTVRI